jgi:four helix bundle protein
MAMESGVSLTVRFYFADRCETDSGRCKSEPGRCEWDAGRCKLDSGRCEDAGHAQFGSSPRCKSCGVFLHLSRIARISAGTCRAPRYSMRGAKRYEDLIVWQLADQARVLVFALTRQQRFARDLKLHSQTEDAVNSMCRNIAEGFGCKHKEFARFLEISRRSLNELRDSFRTAQLKGYVTAREYEPIWRLAHRLYPAYASLIRHLRTTPDPDGADRGPDRTKRKKVAARGASCRPSEY